MKRLNADQKAELLRAFADGERIDSLAERFGVDRSYPAILAKRAGLARRRHQRTIIIRASFQKWRQEHDPNGKLEYLDAVDAHARWYAERHS